MALAPSYNLTGLKNLTAEVSKDVVPYDTRGGNAKVFEASWRGVRVALKRVKSEGQGKERLLLKEANIWSGLGYAFILELYGVCVIKDSLYLISPLHANGNAPTYLKTPEGAGANRFKMVSDVAEGLNFLHTLPTPIIHGDIKGLNILVKNNGDACISDFGLSKRSDEVTTTALRDQGSLRWMARELLDSDCEGPSRSPKTVQSDCYSLGMLMLELFSGNVPYHRKLKPYTILLAICGGELPDDPRNDNPVAIQWITNDTWHIMRRLWSQDPSQRPSAANVASLMGLLKNIVYSAPDENASCFPKIAQGVRSHISRPIVALSSIRCRSPSDQIDYDTDGNVRAGSLAALVTRLTLPEHLDLRFNDIFFMTFTAFATAYDVFDALISRYNQALPRLYEAGRLQIRLRVIHAVKRILQDRWIFDSDCSELLCLIISFAKRIESHHPDGSNQLITLADQLQLLLAAAGPPAQEVSALLSIPINSRCDLSEVLNLDPYNIAEQLALEGHRLYRGVKLAECLKVEVVHEMSGSLASVFTMRTKIIHWASFSILQEDDTNRRIKFVSRFILIAYHCHSINDFASMDALIAALEAPNVQRLTRTWTGVTADARQMYESLRSALDRSNDYRAAREALRTIRSPCVPILDIYLCKLRSIHTELDDVLDENSRIINFDKWTQAADIMFEMRQHQSTVYSFQPTPLIAAFLSKALAVESSPDQYWDWSLTREPL